MLEKEQPIEPKVRSVMNEIGQTLGRVIKQHAPGYGYALLVFKLGDAREGDRMNYISNAVREDMLAAMKEFIARAEGRYEEGNFTRKSGH